MGTSGFGQPVVQARGNSGSNGSGVEPTKEDEPGAAGLPALIETLPAWETISIGLDRAWDKARAAIIELESQKPAASDSKPSARPAVNPRAERTVPAPSQPGMTAWEQNRGLRRRPGRPGRPTTERAASGGSRP